ncbi:hypothetical protein Tco_0012640 [Tanacetum coccineum]
MDTAVKDLSKIVFGGKSTSCQACEWPGSPNSNKSLLDVQEHATEAYGSIEASYDDDGIITDFNNLPDEVDVSTNHTLRIHNAHPQSQILGDPNTPVQTRNSLKKITEAHALNPLKMEAELKLCRTNCCSSSFNKNKKDEEGIVQRNKFMVRLSYEAVCKADFNRVPCVNLLFLGLQVKQNKGGIFISQDKYVAEILKKFDLVNVKAAITPMETKFCLGQMMMSFDVTSKDFSSQCVKEDLKYLKVLHGVERMTGSTWTRKEHARLFHLDSGFPEGQNLRYALTHNPPINASLVKQVLADLQLARTLADGTPQLNCNHKNLRIKNLLKSLNEVQLQLAMLQGVNMSTSTKCCSNPSQPVPLLHHLMYKSSPHNIKLVGGVSQPPPILTQPVQSTSPPPQPSSVQPTSSPPPIQPVQTTSSPPITTIPDTQPTLPPSPQIPSPSYHDTEGPSFEPSYHMSPPLSHEPESQTSRPSEESEQLRNLYIFYLAGSKIEFLEKELRRREKSEETEDAEEAQADPANKNLYLEAAQNLTNVASEEELRDHKPLLVVQTFSSQVNTAEVNTILTRNSELGGCKETPLTGHKLNTGETERVQRRKGKDPMTEEDLQAEVQASKKSKELQELAGLEAAQRLQATMDAETQRQIDLDALLARRLQTADQIYQEKLQTIIKEADILLRNSKVLHDIIAGTIGIFAHAELKSKSFEEIQVLYERYKKQDQTFVAIGSEEDERAIKRMNEQAADKEKEQKNESVHEEVQEEEGAKKRKLGTRRKLKAKRRKYTSKEDFEAVYELVMEEYQDEIPEVLDKIIGGIDYYVKSRTVLSSQMLDLMLETEEESSKVLWSLYKFVKQQLEEFEDSNDDDLVTSDPEDTERV